MIDNKRIRIYPASQEQMEQCISTETDDELKKAYGEMLEGCLAHPDRWPWYAMWMIEKSDGTHVGDLCFKGIEADRNPEIGYGILEEYRGQGYATEAVKLALEWAFRHPGVTAVEAEADPDNAASQKVLTKCGFKPNGEIGEEGPRYIVYGGPAHERQATDVIFQNYADSDYDALCGFLIAINENDDSHINWNWARLEWMIEHPEFDKSLRKSIGLWKAGDRIIGAAIYDMYFGEGFCGVLPEYIDLYPDILKYACRELKDDSGFSLAICDNNTYETETVKGFGFHIADQTEVIMERSLDDDLLPKLSGGLTFFSPDPEKNAYDLQWLFWQGFDHGEDKAEFEKEEEIVPRIRKHLIKDLGVAAVNEKGEMVACCLLWYMAGTDYAYVEPVCVIPSYRGRGVAKAVIFEALRRAKKLGANRAYVISDMEFYERLGFARKYHYSFYHLKNGD